jgi:serine protease AprX
MVDSRYGLAPGESGLGPEGALMMRITRTYFARAWRTLVLGAAVLGLGAPAYAQNPTLDSVVEQALREGGDLPVIVQFKDEASLNHGRAFGRARAAIARESKTLRALSLTVTGRELRALLATPGVTRISYDAPVTGSLLGSLTPETTGVSVEASGSKVARSRYGVSGAGVNVAIIDSGVQPHTDLPASRIKVFVDFVNGRTTAYDDYGHGTHVAGIVAGSGAASSGKWAGVAPGAGIVALKVLDATGAGSTSNVIAALEWVLANHVTHNIRVVNLSLGHPIYEAAATDPLVQMVDTLTTRGIVVVVSAGNMGRNALGQTVYGSITSPANAQGAITVGATDTNYTLPRGDDKVASFSSRGPTKFERYIKPDVVAPGYHIVSLLAPNSYMANKYPELKVSSVYFRLNGTSMAAPVVAGQAALALSANPKLTASAVKGIIQFTAQRISQLDVMTQGAGQVNVAGTVRMAKLICPDQVYGKRWMKGSRKPIGADLLFDEIAYWGRALVVRDQLKGATNSIYVRLAQWDDNIVWGYWLDNIVWGYDDNIVWGYFLDNIVWGYLDDNIVWGLTDDNIVWGYDDNIVWGMLDNVVWGYDDNIVWGVGVDSVLAFSTEEILGLSFEGQSVDAESIMTEGVK